MKRARYFDNAATTQLDPRVLDAMLPFYQEEYGNAHSIHQLGIRAANAVDKAREQVAILVGAEDPSEIIFTSGATESNNAVIRSFSDLLVSPFEHSSIREPAASHGAKTIGSVGSHLQMPDREYELISLMTINNETGQKFDPAIFRAHCNVLHSDITQMLGKYPVQLGTANIDLASMSAHKLYGPKGVGALYIKGGHFPAPIQEGGAQEYGLRAGTLNVPGIVGFGAACHIAANEQEEDLERATRHRNLLLEILSPEPTYVQISPTDGSAFILNFAFRDVQGETLLLELDRQGFCIGSGSACSSRSEEPSPVLVALGLEDYLVRGSVRISFGRFTSDEGVVELGEHILRLVKMIRSLKQ